jgi:hypothetical protein
MKPHRGTLKNWVPVPVASIDGTGLGYMICGIFHGHPWLHGADGHTSVVMVLRPEINEIETRNSRYSVEQPSLAEGMKLYGMDRCE